MQNIFDTLYEDYRYHIKIVKRAISKSRRKFIPNEFRINVICKKLFIKNANSAMFLNIHTFWGLLRELVIPFGSAV